MAYDNGVVEPARAPRGQDGRRSSSETTVGPRDLQRRAAAGDSASSTRCSGQEALEEARRRHVLGARARSHGEVPRRLKDLGFKYATMAGISVGIDDIDGAAGEARDHQERATRTWTRSRASTRQGVITDGERYNKMIDIWTHATTEVGRGDVRAACRDERGGFNPIFMMADSGARGSKEQIRQLAGMRGLMAKPQKTHDRSDGRDHRNARSSANFKEGLSVLEYFISTHGARKGLADTALKTADAGYLTRRLVDVAQDVIINESRLRHHPRPPVEGAQGRRRDHRAAGRPRAGPRGGGGRDRSDLERDPGRRPRS